MGARVNSEVVCPGCKMKTMVGFRYPGVLDPVIFQYECSSCKSTVMVRATRPKNWSQAPRQQHHPKDDFHGPGPGRLQRQVEFASRLVKASDVLVQLLKEEAEHNAKPVEQVDAESGAVSP